MATFEETRPVYARCLWITLGGWLGAVAGYAFVGLGWVVVGKALAYAGPVTGCLGLIRGVLAPVPAMDDAHAPSRLTGREELR